MVLIQLHPPHRHFVFLKEGRGTLTVNSSLISESESKSEQQHLPAYVALSLVGTDFSPPVVTVEEDLTVFPCMIKLGAWACRGKVVLEAEGGSSLALPQGQTLTICI